MARQSTQAGPRGGDLLHRLVRDLRRRQAQGAPRHDADSRRRRAGAGERSSGDDP